MDLSLRRFIVEEDLRKFVIKDKVKSTRKVLRPTIITCVNSDYEEYNVANYVRFYVETTKEIRIINNDKLFISWKTFKNVTRPTLAKWLKQVLNMSKIDTSTFSAHSFRGAGLSKAYYRGASLDQIISAGNWSNSSVFKNHYCAPSYDSHVGQMILED